MNNKRFRKIKPEIRILGIDDAPFPPHTQNKVMLVGTVFRGGIWLDGVLRTHITGDGEDSTRKIIQMVNKTRHKGQIGVIMLDGVTFGGFNLANIKEIFEKTGIPVIVIMRKFPNFERIKKALLNFEDHEKRWNSILDAGKVYKIENREPIYIQIRGIDLEDAKEIVALSTTRSAIPEPIRVAHLIAAGVETGESRGSA
ncbi:MAG: endonuclease dU [Methanobacterium sp.]